MKKDVGLVAILCGVVALFVAFVVYSRSALEATPVADYSEYDYNSYITPDDNNGNIGDHVKGGDLDTAKVVIFEYADFQCPYCASLNPYISSLLASYGGDVVVIYRHYNMSYHENSKAASAAVEAAAMQGYYELYADYLFAQQSDWEYASTSERTDVFIDYFKTVTNNQGDAEQFYADMTSDAVSAKIAFDNKIASLAEVPGTPSFYLDGEKIDYSDTETVTEAAEYIKNTIDEKLAQSAK